MADQQQQQQQAPVGKITLYWLEKSRSQRILWLLEELKVDYELKTFKRVDMLAPPELKKIHPLGKSPVITVESPATAGKPPLVIAESSAITEYLIDHFGPWLAPKRYPEGKEGQVAAELEEWIRYRYFMHYAEGSLMPPLLVAVLVKSIKANTPFLMKPVANLITGALETKYLQPNFTTHFSFLEEQLATSPNNGDFLCGKDLTGADILLSFPLGAARGRAGLTQEAYPKLWAYIDRLEAMDGFKRAVAKIVEIEGSYDPNL